MEIIIASFLFILLIFFMYQSCKKKELKRQALIESVTDLNRGNESEHDLILKLLSLDINPKAIFHDLYLSKNNGSFSQIDLVVATKVGIIVFEVKDYSGWIFGNGYHEKWTQILDFGRQRYKFNNPIKQNFTHIKELKKQLNENVPFFSVIVFYGNSEFKDISFIPKNTFITKDYRVEEVVDSILTENKEVNYKNKYNVMNVLTNAVNNGNKENIEEKHIENVQDMLGLDRVFE